MALALIGLGIIGSIWARHWHKDGQAIRTWNRSPKQAPGFTPDLRQAVLGADLIFIVVADPPAVQEVLSVILPVLERGQTVVQSSTISSHWTLHFAAQVQATGARFLEAPFTGSKAAAENRKTVFYLGGESKDIDAARPAMESLSEHRLHVGGLGQASALKLAMNMNIAMVMEALSESLHFARAQGLGDEVYFDALRLNGSRSGISDLKEKALKTGDFSPQFSLKHMDKDLRLALEDANAIALPQMRNLKRIYERGLAKGWGEKDFAVLAELLKDGPQA